MVAAAGGLDISGLERVPGDLDDLHEVSWAGFSLPPTSPRLVGPDERNNSITKTPWLDTAGANVLHGRIHRNLQIWYCFYPISLIAAHLPEFSETGFEERIANDCVYANSPLHARKQMNWPHHRHPNHELMSLNRFFTYEAPAIAICSGETVMSARRYPGDCGRSAE